MSLSTFNHNLPAPRRITASNLPLTSGATQPGAEPGVEVRVDTLECEAIMDGSLVRAVVGTEKTVPTSNDGHGEIPLDQVPGMGIVLPTGLNIYYLDLAPNSEGTMHRTTSTDYLIVIKGTLTLVTPGEKQYTVEGSKTDYEAVSTEARQGDVVYQRGMMHALSNRTGEWVRVLGVVAGSEKNKVKSEEGEEKVLEDAWLA